MKRSIAGLAAGLLAVSLAGCAAPGGSPEVDEEAGGSTDKLYERTIELTDERIVTCVALRAGYQGGLSCDWDGAE